MAQNQRNTTDSATAFLHLVTGERQICCYSDSLPIYHGCAIVFASHTHTHNRRSPHQVVIQRKVVYLNRLLFCIWRLVCLFFNFHF